jgi:hypothetical protein
MSSTLNRNSDRYPLRTITPFLLLLPNSKINFILPPQKKVKCFFTYPTYFLNPLAAIPPREEEGSEIFEYFLNAR